MKNTSKINLALSALCLVFLMGSCTKEKTPDPVTNTVTSYTSGPVGTTTSLKTGTITNETNPAGTTGGTLSILKDADGNNFVALNADFKSSFATGTVAIYLAKGNGNIDTQRGTAGSATNADVLALGYVQKSGQQYIKIPVITGQGAAFSLANYAYVVLYCENAKVNFGNAALQ